MIFYSYYRLSKVLYPLKVRQLGLETSVRLIERDTHQCPTNVLLLLNKKGRLRGIL